MAYKNHGYCILKHEFCRAYDEFVAAAEVPTKTHFFQKPTFPLKNTFSSTFSSTSFSAFSLFSLWEQQLVPSLRLYQGPVTLDSLGTIVRSLGGDLKYMKDDEIEEMTAITVNEFRFGAFDM